jgi:hypothetical protein
MEEKVKVTEAHGSPEGEIWNLHKVHCMYQEATCGFGERLNRHLEDTQICQRPNKGNPQSVAVVISHKPQSSNVDSDLLTSLPRMRWL